jgi:hypothetical protein
VWGAVGVLGVIALGAWLPLPERRVAMSARQAAVTVGFFVAWLVVLLVGNARIERRFRKPRGTDSRGLE